MILQINKNALELIQQDAILKYPNECCGFLFGNEHGNTRSISAVLPANNTQAAVSAHQFEIEPLAYMKAEQFALDNQLAFLGIYHSHPNHPAVPSEYDLKQALPYFSYLIVSVVEAKIQHLLSWRLSAKHKFFEEKMILI